MKVPVLPHYNRAQTYQWNYDHPPAPLNIEVPLVPGNWTFCGLKAGSPLGVAAGPLLNGRWCLYYASLGFDVLTYKTVRSVSRACYEPPNLQPIQSDQLAGGESELSAVEEDTGSWAVSFGMPSKPPETWRTDIAETKRSLPPGKILSVSVVGTVQEGWTIHDLAADYALCARQAVSSGADCIETNFSCPNVSTVDGQLYQQCDAAAVVAKCVREAIGEVPLIAKIGHIADETEAESLLDALAPSVDALAMTNSVAATVARPDGTLLFAGQRRGICGAAIREASVRQTAMVSNLIEKGDYPLQLIGVGGVFTYDHLRSYLMAGAHAVHLATAAMLDPLAAIHIREQMAKHRP